MRPITIANNPKPPLPQGLRVLHTGDGEPGHILNGIAFDPEVGWTEYEVTTGYGIERWQRRDFVLFNEIQDPQA